MGFSAAIIVVGGIAGACAGGTAFGEEGFVRWEAADYHR